MTDEAIRRLDDLIVPMLDGISCDACIAVSSKHRRVRRLFPGWPNFKIGRLLSWYTKERSGIWDIETGKCNAVVYLISKKVRG